MKKTKVSHYALIIIFLLIFILMLYCNFHTGLLTDDYAYFFDFSDDFSYDNYQDHYADLSPMLTADRITSVWQIFTSMAAHRFCMNGRVIAHFCVQLFLLMPHIFFKVLNAMVFTFEIFIMYRCSVGSLAQDHRLIRVLIPCFAFSCIWIFQPAFGQVNLWLDGSLNYLWAAVITLIYMRGYINLCLTGDFCLSHNRIATILFVLFSFISGAYSENSGLACLVFSFGIMLCTHFIKKVRLKPHVYASFFATLAGFLFLISAPAELAQKVSPHGLNIFALTSSFQQLFDNMSSFLPLIVLCVVLLVLAFLSDVGEDTLIITCMILITSLAVSGCLIIATYITRRSLFLTPVLLTLDCCILLTALLESNRKLVYSFIFAFLLLVPSHVLNGVLDIHRTYSDTIARDKILEESAAAGLKSVYLLNPSISRHCFTEVIRNTLRQTGYCIYHPMLIAIRIAILQNTMA